MSQQIFSFGEAKNRKQLRKRWTNEEEALIFKEINRHFFAKYEYVKINRNFEVSCCNTEAKKNNLL